MPDKLNKFGELHPFVSVPTILNLFKQKAVLFAAIAGSL